ncbi:hypothetical protein [Labedella endophytica]|uniref:Uncharacterized protein n=1 Tax=Labedella endophytica TaxID=1523160 RepID=A0A3S0VG49_9MICO|nr:hypothetical protein [Labedella endophytica]RUR00914.1 hypothetical protein ELQ94_05055 [Labedella endophytica]
MTSEPNVDRFELVLVRPRLSVNPGVRPTVVIGGRGQPTQWGTGTWQRPTDDTTVRIYLFNRVWRYGDAAVDVSEQTSRVVYRAPRLPFGRGRLDVVRSDRGDTPPE